MRSIDPGKYLMALNAAYSMLAKGGYSAKLDTLEEPTEGYMVAIKTLGIYPNISSVNVHTMTWILREEAEKLDSSLLYIGSWLNPETGQSFFEISLNIDNLDKALNIGKIHDQKYIWDVVNKELIKV
jgi:hypothetical protein